jgi:DNA (cytosine-5)-methyltransferase 1
LIKHQWKVADNFAGGGGASLGIEQAMGRHVDVAVNHDRHAVAMHTANHPRTKHYLEDIWAVDPIEAVDGKRCRMAWFSPDCTHFSKARGGKPVSKQIRGLAWVVLRWAAKVRPDVIFMENVEEFRTWGPLTRKRGRERHPQPCRFRRGSTYEQWRQQLKDLGYKMEMQELRACDYGAPTIRKRFFMVARRDRKPIVWPEQTHSMEDDELPRYRMAAECIDWTRECPSIFERKRPLAENTMRRIFNGLRKFVTEASQPFVLKLNHGGDAFRGHGVEQPLQTLTGSREWYMVSPYLATLGHTQNPGHVYSVDMPAQTVMRKNRHMLVAAHIAKHFGGVTGTEVTNPFPTITTRGTQNQLVTTSLAKSGGTNVGEVRAFLLKYYGACTDGQRLDEPGHTVTTKGRLGLVTVYGEPYQIVDIGMRMLTPAELFEVQGFKVRGFRGNEDGYIIDPEIDGKPMSKTAQIAKCGNAVCPPVARALVAANVA